MLEWSQGRASALCSMERVKTVITAGQERYVDATSLGGPSQSELLVQPIGRGTLSGVLFPLCHILEDDPEATVVVLPSDHFVFPEDEFVRYARHAMALAEYNDDRIFLLGAVPDGAVADYGWIRPAWPSRDSAQQRVVSFVEKPSPAAAFNMFKNHWLWNTMTFAAKGRLLWRLASTFRPEVTALFEVYRSVLRAVRQRRISEVDRRISLARTYQQLKSTDLSHDILERAAMYCDVVPLQGVNWSDCGRPERLVSILRQHQSDLDDAIDPKTVLTLKDWALLARAQS